MNDSYTFVMFEIVPVEQLKFNNIQNELSTLLKTLENTGYSCVESSQNKYEFRIKNRGLVKSLATVLGDDEYIWLVTDFFETLLIALTQHDILFALASSKSSQEESPSGRPAWYISTEVGGLIYPSSISRIIVANALINAGHIEFGKGIDCTSSFPRETALSGDITFMNIPINFNDFKSIFDLIGNRPISILSSNLLISQAILDLLKDESALNRVEIAKALPIQLASTDLSDQNKIFSLFNYLTVRARTGLLNEILEELLNISLHLNWEFSKDYFKSLPKDKAFRYALMQKKRLENIEQKERSLRYALQLLQKRYPDKAELLEWEVNNIYSNIVRYSPVYLAWRARLESYIQGEKEWILNLTDLVRKLDWGTLQKNGIVSIEDIQRIIHLLKIDPGSTLTKIRIIIEKMVSLIYKRFFPNKRDKSLANMLHELNERGIFPNLIYEYFNTLRKTGNIGAHQQVYSKRDVEVIFPLFIRVVEWFVDFINHEHVV